MEFRQATLGDADMLLRWRNDPETRANSFSSAEVSMDEHRGWLTQSLANPDRHLLIALGENGQPIGTVRADFSEQGCELSWTVAPECRGKGSGAQMVNSAVERFRNHKLFARIKRENFASQKIAAHAGIPFTLY